MKESPLYGDKRGITERTRLAVKVIQYRLTDSSFYGMEMTYKLFGITRIKSAWVGKAAEIKRRSAGRKYQVRRRRVSA